MTVEPRVSHGYSPEKSQRRSTGTGGLADRARRDRSSLPDFLYFGSGGIPTSPAVRLGYSRAMTTHVVVRKLGFDLTHKRIKVN